MVQSREGLGNAHSPDAVHQSLRPNGIHREKRGYRAPLADPEIDFRLMVVIAQGPVFSNQAGRDFKVVPERWGGRATLASGGHAKTTFFHERLLDPRGGPKIMVRTESRPPGLGGGAHLLRAACGRAGKTPDLGLAFEGRFRRMRFMKTLISSFGLLTASFLLISCGGSGEGGGGADTLQAGKFTILGTRTDGADRAAAKANAENTLVRYPDVDGMVGLWAYNAPACLEAIQAADNDEVKIFSFDEDEAALQGIIDGTIEGTIVQQPYEFGYQSVKYLKDIVDGKKFVIPDDKEIDIEAKTIVKDNVDAHWTRLKEYQRIGALAKAAPAPSGDTRFAFIINNPDPFWEYARAGCFKAQQDFGVAVDFQAPPTGEAAEQNRILEDVLTKGGYDGVALSSLDPANQTDIINKVAAAMPLVCHDSDAPDSNRRFYLGTNNYEAGRMLGKLVKERMPDGGKLMIFVGNLDVLNAQQRRSGLIDELKEG